MSFLNSTFAASKARLFQKPFIPGPAFHLNGTLIRHTSQAHHQPAPLKMQKPENTATFAAGCFWGVEHAFEEWFASKPGFRSIKVGYTGGKEEKPTYQSVCSPDGDHIEAIQIEFEPEKLPYKSLVEFFYRMHDPTTLAAQGPDIGLQYSSVIFANTAEQEAIARETTEKIKKAGWWPSPIVTDIVRASKWWDAEDHHQKYLTRVEGGYVCPSHFVRDFPALD